MTVRENAVAEAFRLAWSGADPGPTDHGARPPEALTLGRPVTLPRDGCGLGALLALSLAADPDRVVGGVRLRRVPSAGGRYPVDAVVDGRGYDPVAHALDHRSAPDDAAVELSLDPRRTAWRYGPRALPVLLLDLGHAAGAVLAAAAVLGQHRAASLVPDGARPRVVIGSRASAGPAALPLGVAGPPCARSVLRARRSTPFDDLDRAPTVPPDVVDGARSRLQPGQRAALLDAGHPLLASLGQRACGHPELGRVGALLVVTGDVEPGADTVAQHVRAGLAVHDAWLAATAAGLAARPVGCWMDAVLRGPATRGRVQHALALGAARA